ncbi:MAG: hypothetical protein Q7S73_02950 [bacterium]|nr:hypothetical protein [bacterium]
MVEKLKLVFQNHRSQLLLYLKTLIFSLVLLIVFLGNFNFIYIGLFVLTAFFLYARPLFEHYYNIYSFLILIAVALLGVWSAAGSSLVWLNWIIFSCLFYLILGIKDYLFIKRSRLYYSAALVLSYYIFTLFFLSDKSDWFLLKYGLAVLAVFLLIREWLAILTSFNFPKRELLAASVAAFLMAQILWGIALLPIGFINSANFALLSFFIIGEFLYKHFTGGISKEFLWQHAALFIFLSAIIFWTSNWSLSF